MLASGKIFIIVSCSGTGKSTLIKKIVKDFPMLEWSISYTTRRPRKGEEDGKDYFFISKDEFISKKENGDFIEWAVVHSNFYGTDKNFVLEKLNDHKFLIFDIDIQGTDQIKKSIPDKSIAIFIAPPSMEELERRLIGRGTDNSGVINERLKNAKKELLRENDYDYLVVNDDLDTAYNELKDIFSREINQ